VTCDFASSVLFVPCLTSAVRKSRAAQQLAARTFGQSHIPSIMHQHESAPKTRHLTCDGPQPILLLLLKEPDAAVSGWLHWRGWLVICTVPGDTRSRAAMRLLHSFCAQHCVHTPRTVAMAVFASVPLANFKHQVTPAVCCQPIETIARRPPRRAKFKLELPKSKSSCAAIAALNP
jgi:hypothetical protein